ncbi:MAG TPA: response regulator [Spirochaetes bacterium]|nr:response regulator [Spirochaetota bacterium]
MGRILIVDSTPYRETMAGTLGDAGFLVETAESAYDAMAKLKSFDFDLVIAEVELPGDNAFDLYNYISTYYPYIPAIMVTDRDMDTFFDRIFAEGIGNVLSKPLRSEELVNLTEKLISKKNIFGLNNYMNVEGDVKKIRISSSEQIRKAVALVFKQIEEWGFSIGNKSVLNLILNELIINAVYHSHGYTSEKENRVQIKLAENEFVDLCFARNQDSYGISITDYKGRLSKLMILDSIQRAIEQTRLILRAAETGEDITDMVSETGRGIDLVRKLSAEYFFAIKNNVRTEIILIFDRDTSAAEKSPSLKIIEDIN